MIQSQYLIDRENTWIDELTAVWRSITRGGRKRLVGDQNNFLQDERLVTVRHVCLSLSVSPGNDFTVHGLRSLGVTLSVTLGRRPVLHTDGGNLVLGISRWLPIFLRWHVVVSGGWPCPQGSIPHELILVLKHRGSSTVTKLWLRVEKF